MTGREQLAAWLERSKMTQREGAALIGMHYTHLNQILSGRRSVGLMYAITIEQATGIPVEAWKPSAVDKRRAVWSPTERKQLVGKK